MVVRIRSRVGMVPEDYRRHDVPDSVKDWPVIKKKVSRTRETAKSELV